MEELETLLKGNFCALKEQQLESPLPSFLAD
jgi:hypothetical protein